MSYIRDIADNVALNRGFWTYDNLTISLQFTPYTGWSKTKKAVDYYCNKFVYCSQPSNAQTIVASLIKCIVYQTSKKQSLGKYIKIKSAISQQWHEREMIVHNNPIHNARNMEPVYLVLEPRQSTNPQILSTLSGLIQSILFHRLLYQFDLILVKCS